MYKHFGHTAAAGASHDFPKKTSSGESVRCLLVTCCGRKHAPGLPFVVSLRGVFRPFLEETLGRRVPTCFSRQEYYLAPEVP